MIKHLSSFLKWALDITLVTCIYRFILNSFFFLQAGMQLSDRGLVESLFLSGDLPVLCATSTCMHLFSFFSPFVLFLHPTNVI
jgi:hypothetical protein